MLHRVFVVLTTIALSLTCAARAGAELTRVDVTTRADIAGTSIEKIVGTAHFVVDPRDPKNAVIADIDKAPVNSAGRVEFAADLYILRQKDASRSNGIGLVEVLNRGRKPVMNGFMRGGSNDPATKADLGDAFLLDRGFTLVWVGWEFDVRRVDGLMTIDVPSAKGVTDFVRGDFTPNDAHEQQTVGDLVGYTPLDAAAADNRLTVRDGQFAKETVIERGRWTLAGNLVTLKGGFEPGRIYNLSYRAKELPISGLGMAAFRDVATWIKHAPDALVQTRQTLAFGSSQSGRFLRTFLYHGFNTDEKGRQVFDAAWAHISGAARLSLNERGATPTSLTMYEITRFPYANAATRDPISGRTEGLLENDRSKENQPKTFFTNTSVEYWGGGRSAALVHTSPDGKQDLKLADNTRVYYLTGSQHGPARFPTKVNQGQQPDNPLEYWWTMRALMVAMEKWIKDGAAPPASQYPTLADRTLVPVEQVSFPALDGVQSPKIIPPVQRDGKVVPFLVPQVDADGNETAGVRTPESLVPLATYTGWNFRNRAIGGPTLLVSLLGSRIPFARTAADRTSTHDPRKAVAERYPSRDAYMAKAREAAQDLVKRGYLLSQDMEQVMSRMEAQWQAATGSTN
jgi:hypothetical protein